MSISTPFINRPIATSLLMAGLLLMGLVAFPLLPFAPLPQVDIPTIQVSASLPGASPETMASTVTTPLERQFGRIAGITQMTSTSSLGSDNITLQFDLDRKIDAAGTEVQAAISAASGQLPAGLPTKPNWRKAYPAESPIQVLHLTSNLLPISQLYDISESIVAQKVAQLEGVGQVVLYGTSRP